MEVILALLSASVYGVADYLGGRASRQVSSITVTFVGQSAALVMLVVLAAVSGSSAPQFSDWMWGGLAGVVGATGLLFFYRSMGSGFMTVAAPISAVVGASIPVLIGLLRGERPHTLAIVAIPIALFAIVLVSDLFGPHHRRAPRIVLILAFVAGVGFGSIFLLLEHTSDTSGLWPVVSMRLTSVPFMFVVVMLTRQRISAVRGSVRVVVLCGIFDSLANVFYLLAVREGLLSVVALIVALYPASTLALAIGIDKERVHGPQIVGLLLTATALAMIAVA